MEDLPLPPRDLYSRVPDKNQAPPGKGDVVRVLGKWRIFRIGREALSQCEPMKQGGCACGKARCFAMNTDTPTGTGDDAFVRSLVNRRLLYPLCKLLNTHLTGYLRLYSKAKGLRYGRDVVLSLKGGNVFSCMAMAFLDAIGHRRPGQFVNSFADALRLGDLDFEVHVDLDDADVRDVAKLSAMALYDVRLSLQSITGTQRKSDYVIVPIDAPGTCPDCNTLYMPVPSVLRSVSNTWYRPERLDNEKFAGLTSLPISANYTLKRMFGADVILLRMKAVHEGGLGEVYDISVPFRADPIHRHLMEHREVWYFKSQDDVMMLSPRHFLYTLRHTFFLEGIPVSQVFKLHKKMLRFCLCLVIVTVTDGQTLTQALDACNTTASIIDGTGHGKVPVAFAEFLNDLTGNFEAFGEDSQTRQEVADTFRAIAKELKPARRERMTRQEFARHLNLKRTIERLEHL